MTSCLNAWLVNTVTSVNTEDRYSGEKDALSLIPAEMLVLAPIAEYLSLVNTVVTSLGDTIRINIPDVAVPSFSIPATADEPAVPPDSFEPADAHSHNVYEA